MDVMLDVELASNDSGAIVQLGAVWFDPHGARVKKIDHKIGMNIQECQFFAVVDLKSLTYYHYSISATALCWPTAQDARNYKVYAQWENVASNLDDVLIRFKSFLNQEKYKHVWSRGFRDVQYLMQAYDTIKSERPFGLIERWRDYRSFVDCREPDLLWPKDWIPHCALDDSLMQARGVQAIYQSTGYAGQQEEIEHAVTTKQKDEPSPAKPTKPRAGKRRELERFVASRQQARPDDRDERDDQGAVS